MSSSSAPTQSGVSPLSSLYGIYSGATSGNTAGQARAGLDTAKLYGSLTGDSALNTGATGALDALGIYQGINQGGWQGDTRAGGSALQLAGLLGNNPALSEVGSGVLLPLDIYNEIENYQSGNTASDAEAGATTGAAIGSIFPGIGTVIGGVAGGAIGALASAFGPGEKDPETYASQNLINATSQYGNNSAVAANVQDPYLELAGMMDERSSTLPEYQQYGRMGEQSFTDALTSKINQAVQANPSLANDPNAVYSQVVEPWVNSMGSGYSNVGQTYTAANQGLLQDMTDQYMGGAAAADWKAVGGDSPFSGIYNNSPFQGQYQTYTADQAAIQQQQQQEQAAMNAKTPVNNAEDPTTRGVSRAAAGGHMKRKSVLDQIRPSFKDVPRHYDDGGYVSYFTPTDGAGIPYSDESEYTNPQLQNVSQASNSPIGNISEQDTGQQGLNSINYGSNPNNSSLGSGGALSGLGSLLGVSSMGQLLQKYGALAPILAAALGGNKTASAPTTPSGYSNSVNSTLPTSNYSRSYTQPNVANWYTYGQGPEQSFFSNNQIPYAAGVSPASAYSGSGGGSSAAPPTMHPTYYGGASTMAHGGSFNSTAGDDYVSDPGHGDGTSDDIDAKLSGGEYVMDAGTVSMLGNGSNEAGARALDQLRQRVRKHAGQKLVKGKQFMKAKPPETYLKGGQS